MTRKKYIPLQLREIFHLEFLRWLSRYVDPALYALKGGVNLRLFFNSIRYSEDIDFDVRTIAPETLQRNVMRILKSDVFQNTLKPFGIESVVPPDMTKAKQTSTTQRFKIHLVTPHDEDFFTKVEFSRREWNDHVAVETVSSVILRAYSLSPVLTPHYTIATALSQKIRALAHRTITQSRDVFDIFLLCSQIQPDERKEMSIDVETAQKARERIFEIGYEQFRDHVVFYLAEEDQKMYDNPAVWGDIQQKALTGISAL